MEPVQLVEGHLVDESLELLDAEEVPRDVEHQAAPGEPWTVVDRPPRHEPGPGDRLPGLDRRWQELPERLRPPEEPGRAAGGDCNTVVDAQPVSLLPERAVAGDEREHEVTRLDGPRRPDDGQRGSRGGPQRRSEEAADVRSLGRGVGDDDPRARPELEHAALRRDGERPRDQRRKRRRAVAHPRTAPAVSPNMILRCTSRKNTITGIAVSVDAAISPPQSVFRLPP